MSKNQKIILLVLTAILLLSLTAAGIVVLVFDKDDSDSKSNDTVNTDTTNTQGNQPPGGQGGSSSATIEQTVGSTGYSQSGGNETKSGQTYTATGTNKSAVIVSDSGTLTLSNSAISSTSATSSNDESSFYGLNAVMLAKGGSKITLTDSTITSNGAGTNGAFATGEGSSFILENVKIKAIGGGAHAVMATNGATMTLKNIDMETTDANSGAIATDRGGGNITVTGGTVKVSGQDSPGIYSTGTISVTGATISSTGAESAVIEGANNITLTDTALTSSKDNKWGVMIYQSMSGDASGNKGTFTMTGGELSNTAKNGPLFYITNTTGVINLTGVKVTAKSGVLLNAAAGNWGTSGSNGGYADVNATGQTLVGNMTADSISTIALALKNSSTLTGSINADNKAKEVTISLDSTSKWTLTANSYVTSLSGAVISGSTVTNIVGNGHNLYYKTSSPVNSTLNGKTYSLTNGGKLIPN